MFAIPADKERGKVGSKQSSRSSQNVNCVSQNHRWLSSKAGEQKCYVVNKKCEMLGCGSYKSLVNPQRRQPTVLPIQKMVWINIGL